MIIVALVRDKCKNYMVYFDKHPFYFWALVLQAIPVFVAVLFFGNIYRTLYGGRIPIRTQNKLIFLSMLVTALTIAIWGISRL
jgi:hypothetical protein